MKKFTVREFGILLFVLAGSPFIIAGMLISAISAMFMAGWGMVDTWIADW